MHQALKDVGPFAGHSPDRERPLGGYAVLTGTFFAAAGGFAAWLARSGREVPSRIDATDFALVATSTHKLARLIAKDRVTSFARAPFTRFEDDAGPGEVSEEARGRGLRRAAGELLVCPYCLGLWVASAETAGLLVAPKATRWTMTALSALLVSDFLQMAYVKTEEQL
jgi:hypothetical protein